MYGAGVTPAPFVSGRDGIAQILYADALPGVGLVAAAENAVRQLQIADKALMDHDALCSVLSCALGFVYVDVVDQLPQPSKTPFSI